MQLDLAPATRFLAHLPTNGDLELAILKTHLLVEELLTAIIVRAARRSDKVETARLRFAQKLELAQAFNELAWDSWLAESITLLNTTRNKLAHSLSAADVQRHCDSFVAVVERQHGVPDAELTSTSFGRFHWAAFRVFAILAIHARFDPATLRQPTMLGGPASSATTA
jgi:hypothetical protein